MTLVVVNYKKGTAEFFDSTEIDDYLIEEVIDDPDLIEAGEHTLDHIDILYPEYFEKFEKVKVVVEDTTEGFKIYFDHRPWEHC